MNAALPNRGPTGSAKWGDAARGGFQFVPDALLIKQEQLGLDPTDIVVLLNLTSFWWFRDAPPFARTNIVAQRMGVTTRTVQRSLKKLEGKGYIRRGDYDDGSGSILPAVYLDGIVNTLGILTKSDPALSQRYLRSIAPPEGSEGDGTIPF